MGTVKVAIVGVGNCAASLVQGVEYYRDADETTSVPGLMHVRFGDYHVSDIQFVAAFDVDAKKVGRDLSEAIVASENNTIKICDVPPLGVTVQRGTTLDGLGKYYRETIEESDEQPVDMVTALRESGADVLVCYLPVGSQHAAVLEQLGQHPVGDGGPDLAFDVVADDRDARGGELVGPLLGAGDEHRQRVDECDAGVQGALGVELDGGLGADRQVADQHVGAGLGQRGDDVDGLLVGLLDHLPVVLAEAVEGGAALHGHAEGGHVADLDGVVLAGDDGLGQVAADLLGIDVEGGDELHVGDVVRAEPDVHQTGHGRGLVGIAVVVHALDQRR
ncbi:MAG: hypothetical protein ACXVYC_18240, partial [Blastococcus sp.]